MRHKVKKIRFGKGKDASEATMRKLALNFIYNGKIKTTLAKAKKLKSFIDRITFKAKEKKESTKNVLLKHFRDERAINKLLDIVAPKFNDRNSGFVRVIKLGKRLGDGAEMGKVQWVKPIIQVKSEKLTLNQNKFGSGLPRTDLRSGTGVKVQKKAKQKENGESNKINKADKGERS
jgi:large subunit ribosomal protein L17